MTAKPGKNLGMEYVQIWKRDFMEETSGEGLSSAEWKSAAYLLFAYVNIVFDGDVDEVRSHLPKKLHRELDKYIIPRAERVRTGYDNSVTGKARKAREKGAQRSQEEREKSARESQEERASTSRERTDPNLPAETQDLGSTLIKSKAKAKSKAINQCLKTEAESDDHGAMRTSPAGAVEAQAHGLGDGENAHTWKIHERKRKSGGR